MKLGWAKRRSGVIGIASVATLILATVVTSSMSDEQDANARDEKRNVSDQHMEDDGSQGSLQESKEPVMTICLMPSECS
ncbi:MAG: hypothetical protein WBX01_13800 [Nitrososphaeraceae archaeon]|jgi:hypothetical protein